MGYNMTMKPEDKSKIRVNVDVDLDENEDGSTPSVEEAMSTVPGDDKKAIATILERVAKDPEKGKVIYKTFVAELKAAKKDDFTAEIVISNGDIDRDRERVDPKGIYVASPKRVPLVAGHSYGDLRKHIGDIPKIKRSDNEVTAIARWLVGQGNPEADWGWNLAMQGLTAFSIGFLPEEYVNADISDEKVMERVRAGKEPIRTYTKSEVVEVSQVIVPSNRSAILQLEAEGVLSKDLAADALERAKDEDMSAKAQEAFDAALAAWKKKAVPTEVVDEKGKQEDEHDCPEGHHYDEDEDECVKDKDAEADTKADAKPDIWEQIESALPDPPKETKKPKAPATSKADEKQVDEAVNKVLDEVKVLGEKIRESLPEQVKEQVDKALKEAGLSVPLPQQFTEFATLITAQLLARVNTLVDQKIAKAQGDVDAFRQPKTPKEG